MVASKLHHWRLPKERGFGLIEPMPSPLQHRPRDLEVEACKGPMVTDAQDKSAGLTVSQPGRLGFDYESNY